MDSRVVAGGGSITLSSDLLENFRFHSPIRKSFRIYLNVVSLAHSVTYAKSLCYQFKIELRSHDIPVHETD